ncbi:MAG: hypothetical protein DCF26_10850 [Burkholderiales bacterium]|nr:MAG: hypothetical protein DCF26_10850 [Burkholderiales bacterium]
MNRLNTELRRLYLVSHAEGTDASVALSPLVSQEGQVRALVLGLARPADWSALSAVWQGVQADLELPAPAIAVAGADGLQLWFSLSQPVAVEQAQTFLQGLRLRYLGHIAPARIDAKPRASATAADQLLHARVVPASLEGTDNWSAFVSSDLAAVFAEEPWLDLPPGPDAQAELLSRLASIAPADFELALAQLGPIAPTDTPLPSLPAAGPTAPQGAAPGDALHPRRFLMAVMNDPGVALALRIEAAKALLPYADT